jgi:hypothetical protein
MLFTLRCRDYCWTPERPRINYRINNILTQLNSGDRTITIRAGCDVLNSITADISNNENRTKEGSNCVEWQITMPNGSRFIEQDQVESLPLTYFTNPGTYEIINFNYITC